MSPTLILLLVTHSDGRAILTPAIQRAIIDILGPIKVLTEEAPRKLLDEEAAQRGREVHAVAVYQVVWERFEPPAIELRTWIRGTATEEQWIVREFEFAYDDSPTEIARTIGYAAAAMLQPPRPRNADSPSAADSPQAVRIAEPAARARSFLLDLVGDAGVTDNRSLAWGGGLRVGWTATGWLRPTMAVTGSTENLDDAQIRASRLNLGLGGVLTLMTTARASLALRAEVEAVLQIATRFSQSQGQIVFQSRWLPAATPALEVAIAPSSGTALMLSGGYEVAAGRTDLYVGGVKTATIPSSRATAEIGVRVRF